MRILSPILFVLHFSAVAWHSILPIPAEKQSNPSGNFLIDIENKVIEFKNDHYNDPLIQLLMKYTGITGTRQRFGVFAPGVPVLNKILAIKIIELDDRPAPVRYFYLSNPDWIDLKEHNTDPRLKYLTDRSEHMFLYFAEIDLKKDRDARLIELFLQRMMKEYKFLYSEPIKGLELLTYSAPINVANFSNRQDLSKLNLVSLGRIYE